jgi:hypothetical protein
MSAVRLPRELYPERSMPVDHRDLDESTAYRFLQQQCGQQAGTIGRMMAEYEELADRYNDARAELAAWRAWGAARPTTRGDAP